VAALSAIAFLPIVLLVGIMANDSGTPAGERASLIVLATGTALSGWVLVCSVAPALVPGWIQRSSALRFLVVKLPVYAFAIGGVSICLMRLVTQIRVHAMSAGAVLRPSDPSYPLLNPNPREALEIGGALPQTIPVSTLIAVYNTDIESTNMASTACQRLWDLGPKQLWHVAPLRKEDQVPVGASDGRFRVTAYVDRYLPGRCNWHLSEIHYRLSFKDAPPLDYLLVQLLDPSEQSANASKGGRLERGPAHVWCGKALNRAVTPYFPVRCGDYSDFRFRIPPALAAHIPPQEATRPRTLVLPVPGTSEVEVDFYDVDAPDLGPVSSASSIAGSEGSEDEAGAARNARAIQCERDLVRRLQWFFRSRPPEACRQAKVRELMHDCVMANGGADSEDPSPYALYCSLGTQSGRSGLASVRHM